ncbi:hypothetical protein HYX10_00925 [Candidatus Woesearchaeota archaeon]|nr:hypothetical protein [Candidatus Woesearchaeota archaeon]
MPIRPEESKWKKRTFTIVIFIVLFSSVIGFTFSAVPFGLQGGDDKIKYNGIEFFPTQTGLATQVDGQIFEFSHYPEDLADEDVAAIADSINSAAMIYATSDANSSIAGAISSMQYDVSRLIGADTFVQVAFTAENEFGKEIITCEDATESIPVLYFNFTNATTEITEEANCIIVNAESETALSRIKDKTMYELLGVKP